MKKPLFLFLSSYTTLAINVKVSSHTNEFSIFDSKYAREIFLSLPVKNTHADLVHGLIFRYHKYIFCGREPNRKFHCHFYLNGKGEGELSSFHKDTDFGKGSIMEYLETKRINSTADISYSNNRLRIQFDNDLAKRFWEKLDLIPESYRQVAGKKIELRNGRMLNCVNENNNYKCQFNIPIYENNFKKPDLL